MWDKEVEQGRKNRVKWEKRLILQPLWDKS